MKVLSTYEVFKSLKSMENDKLPGNDRRFKEFYECFRDEIKKAFWFSILKAFLNQKLSTQKQSKIKMLEKKTKRLIKN